VISTWLKATKPSKTVARTYIGRTQSQATTIIANSLSPTEDPVKSIETIGVLRGRLGDYCGPVIEEAKIELI
jgi:hypothetical protein